MLVDFLEWAGQVGQVAQVTRPVTALNTRLEPTGKFVHFDLRSFGTGNCVLFCHLRGLRCSTDPRWLRVCGLKRRILSGSC